MPKVEFSIQLAEHVGCPSEGELVAGTLRSSLNHWFLKYPAMSEYLLDEKGALRGHLSVFVDGQMVAQEEALETLLGNESEVFVMQAISGG